MKSRLERIGIITQERSYIPGIRNVQEMGEVGLFDPSQYYAYEAVSEKDAIEHTLKLIRQTGMLV